MLLPATWLLTCVTMQLPPLHYGSDSHHHSHALLPATGWLWNPLVYGFGWTHSPHCTLLLLRLHTHGCYRDFGYAGVVLLFGRTVAITGLTPRCRDTAFTRSSAALPVRLFAIATTPFPVGMTLPPTTFTLPLFPVVTSSVVFDYPRTLVFTDSRCR